jgi:hypothetical protein
VSRIVEPLEDRRLLAIWPANVFTAGVRDKFDVEGYLSYSATEFSSSLGNERSGYTTARHPSSLGNPDATNGYDIGLPHVDIHAMIVTADDGKPAKQLPANQGGGRDVAAIQRDFDFANQIYSQIGISVVIPPDQLIEREFANLPIPLPDVGKNIIADYSGWDGVGEGNTCVEAYSPKSPSIILTTPCRSGITFA